MSETAKRFSEYINAYIRSRLVGETLLKEATKLGQAIVQENEDLLGKMSKYDAKKIVTENKSLIKQVSDLEGQIDTIMFEKQSLTQELALIKSKKSNKTVR